MVFVPLHVKSSFVLCMARKETGYHHDENVWDVVAQKQNEKCKTLTFNCEESEQVFFVFIITWLCVRVLWFLSFNDDTLTLVTVKCLWFFFNNWYLQNKK